jgi:hypothetical protein
MCHAVQALPAYSDAAEGQLQECLNAVDEASHALSA